MTSTPGGPPAGDTVTTFETDNAQELPTATLVINPFDAICLVGDALDRCRRLVQAQLYGHRGCAHDPLNRAKRTLRTGTDGFTDQQP